jgi:hypothetical protein
MLIHYNKTPQYQVLWKSVGAINWNMFIHYNKTPQYQVLWKSVGGSYFVTCYMGGQTKVAKLMEAFAQDFDVNTPNKS